MPDPIASASELTVRYGPHLVLDRATVALGEGERVGLVGRNGSGKSTFLRIAAGELEPDSGQFTRRRDLITGYLPQVFTLDDTATVEANIRSGAQRVLELLAEYESVPAESPRAATLLDQINHHDGWALDHRIESLATNLHAPPLDRLVGTLSGGEKRRVALCRALLARPDFLILDEPTNHLDTESIEWLEDFLARYSGACLFVTHDRYFLDRIATRMLELSRGDFMNYDGSYNDYLVAKAEREAAEARVEHKRQMFLKHELEWVRRGPSARRTKSVDRIERYFEEAAKGPPEQEIDVELIIPPAPKLANRIITLTNVGMELGERTLFDYVNLDLAEGQRLGIVGRNGLGKSTLLKIITGEYQTETGGISYPKNWRVGMVRQEVLAGPTTLLDTVLAADVERAALLDEAEHATDPHRIAEIHTRLADMGAHAAPSRAASILAGLGFDEEAQARPCSDFSGGWRMRVALAAVLFSEPDLLLLDEPTNYLDLEGTIWLEDYLKAYPYTVLIVSHDRDLLNNVADAILHLEHKKLTFYSGNYDRFDRTRREKLMLQMSMKKKQEDARRHMESFVERFKAKASKARQAQSRMKALAKMEPIADILQERVMPLRFPAPDKPLASPIIRLEHASVGYEPDKPVLTHLDLRIDQDDRIALLGANGNGKSTFAKLLCDRLSVTAGHKYDSKKLRIAYFAQHQLDELAMGDTPYEHFRELMPTATQAQVRAVAGSYGFGADKADTKVEKLSGGEKARLLFAVATFNKPHMIILDEPTNHLDVDSREALVMAINDYDGAFILISHDRHLVETCADRLWLVADGTVKPYDGDLDDYRKWLLDPARRVKPMAAGTDDEDGDAPTKPKASKNPKEARRLAAQLREQYAPLKKKAQAAEKEMARLQSEIAKLDADLAHPEQLHGRPDEATRIAKVRADALRTLAQTEEIWLEASAAYEQAMGRDVA